MIYFLLLRLTVSFGLGVDFGSQFHKGSMLLPGKYFTMVEDSISKRKTPSIISFCKDKRFYEYQAEKRLSKDKCDTFQHMRRFFNNKEALDFFKNEQQKYKDLFEERVDELGHLMTLRKKNIPEFSTYPRNTEEIRLEEIYGMMI